MVESEIYVIRHAATRPNLDGLRIGRLDPPLAPAGVAQALGIAEMLRDVPLEAIWSSPLTRAMQTAELVRGDRVIEVQPVDTLLEIALGPWEGMTEEQIQERYPRELRMWQEDPEALDVPGHERIAAVRDRVVGTIEQMAREHACAACVTHLGPIRLMLLHYQGRATREYGTVPAEDCDLVKLTFTDERVCPESLAIPDVGAPERRSAGGVIGAGNQSIG